MIGPIGHDTANQKVQYPRATKAPIDQFAPMNLLAHWLKGEPSGVEKLKAVNYYVMGDTDDFGAPGNFWRSADTWPPPALITPFYFHADHALGEAPPSGPGRLSFKYDPQNPVPTLGGQNLYTANGPMDQRPVESRPDVLLFTSEPLQEPVEVTGRITATLFISSDCPDTDFTVKLCDVYPNGKSMLVTDGIQRASLRDRCETRQLLEPDEVYKLDVDLWSTSLILDRGHRLRIAISSSNSPRFEPNANTGDPHPSSGKSRIATNTVHLSAKHPSRILLPVYSGSDAVVRKIKPRT